MQSAVAKIIELQSAVGTNQKHTVLRKYKDDENFCKLIYYALNPMLTYKISEQTMSCPIRYDPAITLTLCDIYTVCDTLSARKALDNVYFGDSKLKDVEASDTTPPPASTAPSQNDSYAEVEDDGDLPF